MALPRRSLVLLVTAGMLFTSCGSSKNASSANASLSSTTTSSTQVSTPSTTTAKKNLPNGEYVGKFTNVEAELKLANFTPRCPASASGAYLVNLVQATFDVETNPTDPAAGRVIDATFEDWSGSQASQEWVVIQTDASVGVRSYTAPIDHSIC